MTAGKVAADPAESVSRRPNAARMTHGWAAVTGRKPAELRQEISRCHVGTWPGTVWNYSS